MTRWFRFWLGLLPALSVAGALVSSTLLRFHTPPHQTGRADFPHPAFGQRLISSLTQRGVADHAVGLGRSSHSHIVWRSVRLSDCEPCVWHTTTDETAGRHKRQLHDACWLRSLGNVLVWRHCPIERIGLPGAPIMEFRQWHSGIAVQTPQSLGICPG